MVMQQQKRQRRKYIPWKGVIATIAILFLSACVLLWVLNTEHIIQGEWSNVLLIVFMALAPIFALLAWLFPFSPDQSKAPRLPFARELVRGSFRMGDNAAANFPYITEPIQDAYNAVTQALSASSRSANTKHGILILSESNAGKTRLAFEALTKTLPNWEVLLWSPAYDTPSEVPALTALHEHNLVIFIDDLQEYVPAESNDANVQVYVPDSRITTLQTFLDKVRATEHIVIVATCRLEDETRVGARLRWLFDELEVITLPSFNVDIHNPESAKIIDLFQKHGQIHEKEWDGTLGSLVLGLSRKRSQYEGLVNSHNPAVYVLHAMKLLTLALTTAHTKTRIQGICAGIFGEQALQENTKTWRSTVSLLTTRLQFVTEEMDKTNGNIVLVIRKDSYFDKVITDYPTPNQLNQDFEQLRKVLEALKDHYALVNLGNALYNRKLYTEALVAYERAITLDPSYARAHNGKGNALNELKRYDEALDAFEQAILRDPNYVSAYNNKGWALNKLKRYGEALDAHERAITLDPSYARAYNGKGWALNELKRYDEALAAYERAITLDPDYAPACNGKGWALNRLKRYDEALDAFEQAIDHDPNYAPAYNGKRWVLNELKRYDEALAVYEQAKKFID